MSEKTDKLAKELRQFLDRMVENDWNNPPVADNSQISKFLKIWEGENPSWSVSQSGEAGDAKLGEIPKEIGGYQIEKTLGRGGFGTVFFAREKNSQRPVALKWLHRNSPHARMGFFRESVLSSELKHPAIVQSFGLGEHEGRPYFVMEFIDGSSLAKILSSMKKDFADSPDPSTIAGIAIEMAKALAFLHRNGIVHRDFKPGNILIDREGNARLSDLGLAYLAGSESAAQKIGTVPYMSPEQLKGAEPGPASDVFSFGCSFYEALCFHKPFEAQNDEETAALILHADPVAPSRWNPKIPKSLDAILLKCLVKDPAKRFASGEELSEQLLRWTEGKKSRIPQMGFAALLIVIFGFWFFSDEEAQKEIAKPTQAPTPLVTQVLPPTLVTENVLTLLAEETEEEPPPTQAETLEKQEPITPPAPPISPPAQPTTTTAQKQLALWPNSDQRLDCLTRFDTHLSLSECRKIQQMQENPYEMVPYEKLSPSSFAGNYDPKKRRAVVNLGDPDVAAQFSDLLTNEILRRGAKTALLEDLRTNHHPEGAPQAIWERVLPFLIQVHQRLNDAGTQIVVTTDAPPYGLAGTEADQLGAATDGLGFHFPFSWNVCRQNKERTRTEITLYRKWLDEGKLLEFLSDRGPTLERPAYARYLAAMAMIVRRPGDSLFVERVFPNQVPDWAYWPEQFGKPLGEYRFRDQGVVLERSFERADLVIDAVASEDPARIANAVQVIWKSR